MIALSGKTVLVTGATSGIGLEASVKLARMGASLVLVGRDRAKTDAACGAVKRHYYEKNRKVPPSRLAQDRAVATKLWQASAALTGLPQ